MVHVGGVSHEGGGLLPYGDNWIKQGKHLGCLGHAQWGCWSLCDEFPLVLGVMPTRSKEV